MRRFEIMRGFEKAAAMPERKTRWSAGYDIAAADSIIVPCDGRVVLVQTGIKVLMRQDEFLMISLRSSVAAEGIIMPNAPAIIDADYYNNESNGGHIYIPLIATNRKTPYFISAGQRIAQGVFIKYLMTETAVAETVRVGGIGSTG